MSIYTAMWELYLGEKNSIICLKLIFTIIPQKCFGCPEGWFLRVWVYKWCLDALLAKPWLWWLSHLFNWQVHLANIDREVDTLVAGRQARFIRKSGVPAIRCPCKNNQKIEEPNLFAIIYIYCILFYSLP